MAAKRLKENEIARGLREYAKLTIADVAQLTGINMATLSLFENGKCDLSEKAKKELDAALRKALIDARQKDERLAKAAKASIAFPSSSAEFINMTVGSRRGAE